MSIAVDATSSLAVNGTPTRSFTHVCAAGATLYVCVRYNNASDPATTSATYNGTAMTKIATRSSVAYHDLYRLTNPDSGSHSVTISYTNSHTVTAIGISLTGVTSDGTPVTEDDGDGAITNTSVNSTDYVLNFVWRATTSDLTPTGTNQTGQAAINEVFSAGRLECSTSTGNSGSVVSSWSGGSGTWSWNVGVVLVGATAYTQSIDETLTLSEAVAMTTATSMSESITLSETMSVGPGVSISESISLTETIAFIAGIGLTDTLTLTESMGNALAATLADTITLTEAMVFGIGVLLAETITLDEALGTINAFVQALSDAITLSEALISAVTGDGLVAPTWTGEDLSPGDTGTWTDAPATTDPTWTIPGGIDEASTVEVACDMTPSDMFCDREGESVDTPNTVSDSMSLSESLDIVVDAVPTEQSTTRLFTNGFEEGELTNTGWDITFTAGTGSVAVSLALPRTGIYSGLFTNPANSAATLLRYISNSGGVISTPYELYARFYANFVNFADTGTGRAHLVSFNVDQFTGTAGQLAVRGDGKLQLNNRADTVNTTGTYALTTGTWYRIEFAQVVGSGGSPTVTITAKVYLGDSTTELDSITYSETISASLLTVGYLRLGNVIQGTHQIATWYCDDVAVQRDPLSYCGPGHVLILQVASDSSVAWTRSSGSVNATLVGDIPLPGYSDATYVKTSGSSTEDKLVFPVPVALPAGALVHWYDGVARTRAETGSLDPMAMLVWDQRGTKHTGPNVVPQLSFKPVRGAEHIALNWASGITGTQLGTMFLGYKRVSGSAETRISTAWANIEYTV